MMRLGEWFELGAMTTAEVFLLILAAAALAPSLPAQNLLRASGGPPTLPGTDMAVLEAREARKDLPCTATPVKPVLGFDLRFHAGYEISPYYDSMIGKLIAYGKNRTEAISVCKRALDEFVIEPIKTTIPFHKKVMNNPAFLRGKFSTDFIGRLFEKAE